MKSATYSGETRGETLLLCRPLAGTTPTRTGVGSQKHIDRPRLSIGGGVVDRKPPLLDVGSPLPSPIFTLASASDALAYLGAVAGPAHLQRQAQAQAAQQQVIVSPPRPRGSPTAHLAASSSHLYDMSGLATSPHLSELHDGEPAPHFGLDSARGAVSFGTGGGVAAVAAAAALARARGVADGGAAASHLRMMLPSLPPSPLNSLRVTQLPSLPSILSMGLASGSLTASLTGAGARESFEISPSPTSGHIGVPDKFANSVSVPPGLPASAQSAPLNTTSGSASAS